jgi:hypothetical protein
MDLTIRQAHLLAEAGSPGSYASLEHDFDVFRSDCAQAGIKQTLAGLFDRLPVAATQENFCSGSKPDERGHHQERLLLKVKQTKLGPKRTLSLECRLSGVRRTLWGGPSNFGL